MGRKVVHSVSLHFNNERVAYIGRLDQKTFKAENRRYELSPGQASRLAHAIKDDEWTITVFGDGWYAYRQGS